MAKATEREPTEKEEAMVRSLLRDSLLSSQPLIYHNVRAALQVLLIHLGRAKLAAAADQV